MKSRENLINFLFNESQNVPPEEELLENLVDLFEAAEGEERLEIKKKPLIDALKEIGLDGVKLEQEYGAFCLNLENTEDYNVAIERLQSVEAIDELAQLGWVAFFGDNDSPVGAEPSYKIRFLELDVDDEPENKQKVDDLEKLAKDAIELGMNGPKDERHPKSESKQGQAYELVERLISGGN